MESWYHKMAPIAADDSQITKSIYFMIPLVYIYDLNYVVNFLWSSDSFSVRPYQNL